MLKNKSKNGDKTYIPKKFLIFLFTFIIAYVSLITSNISTKYTLKEGDIAKIDIKAPRDIVDEDATELNRNQALASVPDQYNKSNEVKSTVISNINGCFAELSYLKSRNMDENQKIQEMGDKSPVKLSDEDFKLLLKLSENESSNLQELLITTMTELYDNNGIGDNQQDVKNAQEFIATKINSSRLSSNSKSTGINIGYNQIKTNMFFDEEKTKKNREEVLKSVANVVIKKDQIIVKGGEPVTEKQLKLLKTAGLLNEGSFFQWHVYTSIAVLVLLIMALQWEYLKRFYKYIYEDNSKLFLISILNCFSIVMAKIFSMISPFLIPLACVPMLLTMFINYKISTVLSVINIVLISASIQFNPEVTVLAIINAVLAAVIIKKMHARNDIANSAIFITIVNIICTFCIGIILSNDIMEVLRKTLFAGIACIISSVLTLGLLPFFESTFDIVTILKLLELSNPNNPLLKKLLIEAPGTYHHSILVANLAEMAADEVGANAVLARVGAYYHDIGKIERPYFFKENQMNMVSPHNKISPDLSATIITSHVKEGSELAKEYNIPQAIREIIEQHHGNSLVKYFYITMKNSSEDPEEINEEEFRYPSVIPSSKEAAIVMLADCVEASVRSIEDPTAEKVEVMINNIIKDKLDDGQLNNCDLTFKDIEKIKKVFLKSINAMFHKRIEYPTEKFKDEGERE